MSGSGKGIIILGILLIAVGVGLGLLAFYSLIPLTFILVALILVILGMLTTLGGYLMSRKSSRVDEIREKGLAGSARLLNWWLLGKSGGELEAVEFFEFELEIHLDQRSPYTVKHRQLVPYEIYNRFQKGLTVPVKVHPDKHEKVIIDWDRP
jgi:hypothetical protein